MMAGRGHGARHILLVGFMGSGKSTVARELSIACGWPVIDMDDGIERMVGRPITDIFADEGEAAFRSYEHEYLLGLADERPSIVSCGGGVVVTEPCRELLPRLGCVVFLEVGADEALARIGSSSSRPLLKGAAEMRVLLEERLPWYRAVADMTIDTSGKEPGRIASELKAALEERGVLR